MKKTQLVDMYGRKAGSEGYRNPMEPLPHLFEKTEECYYIAFEPEEVGKQAIHKIDRGDGVKKVQFAWGEWGSRASLNYTPINGDECILEFEVEE